MHLPILAIIATSVALAAPSIQKRSVTGDATVNLDVRISMLQSHRLEIPSLQRPNIKSSSPFQIILQSNILTKHQVDTGTILHLASGFIYGIPDTANQIPAHFYSDIKFQYGRAGGAQVAAPGRGWIWGLTEYKNRFASALSNYRTVRQNGGTFIFLIHDLWGADGTQNSTAPYPGT